MIMEQPGAIKSVTGNEKKALGSFLWRYETGNFISTTNKSTGLEAEVRGPPSDVERICNMLTCFSLKIEGMIFKH